MVDLPSGEDDFGEFSDEGLLINSFTPSELVTNDPSSDDGSIIVLHFGSCLERMVDYNMILTLPIKFRARQDQVSEVEKELR